MKLDSIDWATITRKQASSLIGAANAHEQAMARRFDADEVTEAEWWKAFQLWEDLRVYSICGEKPEGAQ